jgi:hypothetical protein
MVEKNDLIKPFNESISIEQHVEFLKQIERVQENFIQKKVRNRNKSEQENLERIRRSIEHFEKQLHENKIC